MEAADVRSLGTSVAQRGAQWCVAGGWGIDALIGHQTRPHHDLDVLIDRRHLRVILDVLRDAGFREAFTWEESRPVPEPGEGAGLDSAFVMSDAGDRVVDIHVFEPVGGWVRPLWTAGGFGPTGVKLSTADLAAEGTIDAAPVACLSAAKQLEVHAGYDLPPTHQRDVELLRALVTD